MDMSKHVAEFVKNQTCFAHIAFEAAFSKIKLQSAVDFLLIFQNTGAKPFQHVNPCFYRKSPALIEKCSLLSDQFFALKFVHNRPPA